jgi:hypothetical protein
MVAMNHALNTVDHKKAKAAVFFQFQTHTRPDAGACCGSQRWRLSGSTTEGKRKKK